MYSINILYHLANITFILALFVLIFARILNFAILPKPYFARIYFRDFDGPK